MSFLFLVVAFLHLFLYSCDLHFCSKLLKILITMMRLRLRHHNTPTKKLGRVAKFPFFYPGDSSQISRGTTLLVVPFFATKNQKTHGNMVVKSML